MTLPILNYQKVTNVAGGRGWLAALRSFAISQGWTSEDYQTGVSWGGASGWVSGSDDFLQLFSNGYGSQVLRYRFYVYTDPTYSNTDWIWYTAIDPNFPNYSNISTNPVFQNDWQGASYYYRSNVPSGTMPACWFFGQGKRFLLSMLQMTTEIIHNLALGTIELLPEIQGTDELQFYWGAQYARLSPQFYWWNLGTALGEGDYWHNCFRSATNNFSWRWCWWDGGSQYQNEVTPNITLTTYEDDLFVGWFGELSNCVQFNAFTNKRVAQQPTIFVKDPSSGLFYVAGTIPIVYIIAQGIGWGDTITFGTDEYLGFPHGYITNTKGMAIRIS